MADEGRSRSASVSSTDGGTPGSATKAPSKLAELRRQLEEEVSKREALERTMAKARELITSERQTHANGILEERRQRELLEEQQRMSTMELQYLRGEQKRLKEEVVRLKTDLQSAQKMAQQVPEVAPTSRAVPEETISGTGLQNGTVMGEEEKRRLTAEIEALRNVKETADMELEASVLREHKLLADAAKAKEDAGTVTQALELVRQQMRTQAEERKRAEVDVAAQAANQQRAFFEELQKAQEALAAEQINRSGDNSEAKKHTEASEHQTQELQATVARMEQELAKLQTVLNEAVSSSDHREVALRKQQAILQRKEEELALQQRLTDETSEVRRITLEQQLQAELRHVTIQHEEELKMIGKAHAAAIAQLRDAVDVETKERKRVEEEQLAKFTAERSKMQEEMHFQLARKEEELRQGMSQAQAEADQKRSETEARLKEEERVAKAVQETTLKHEQEMRSRIAALDAELAARLTEVQIKETDAQRRVEESDALLASKHKELHAREAVITSKLEAIEMRERELGTKVEALQREAIQARELAEAGAAELVKREEAASAREQQVQRAQAEETRRAEEQKKKVEESMAAMAAREKEMQAREAEIQQRLHDAHQRDYLASAKHRDKLAELQYASENLRRQQMEAEQKETAANEHAASLSAKLDAIRKHEEENAERAKEAEKKEAEAAERERKTEEQLRKTAELLQKVAEGGSVEAEDAGPALTAPLRVISASLLEAKQAAKRSEETVASATQTHVAEREKDAIRLAAVQKEGQAALSRALMAQREAEAKAAVLEEAKKQMEADVAKAHAEHERRTLSPPHRAPSAAAVGVSEAEAESMRRQLDERRRECVRQAEQLTELHTELFYLLAIHAKSAAAASGKNSNVSIPQLYERAQKARVPRADWGTWLKTQLRNPTNN